MFTYTENVFNDRILYMLQSRFCRIKNTDNSSYEVWPKISTANHTLPKAFSETVTDGDRIALILALASNQNLPFCRDERLKFAQFAVQKMPANCSIPLHTDTCKASLTVFLSDDTEGGEFVWLDNDAEVAVVPKVNCGVYAYFDSIVEGATHKTNPVTGTNTRYTLQMFLK
jgi:hypothetical protein